MESRKKKMKFDDLPKRDIFKAPDGYFDSLPERLVSRISNDETKVRTISSPWRAVGYVAAASVTLIAILWFANSDSFKQVTPQETLAQVSTEDLASYLESEEIDLSDIIEGADSFTWDENPIDLLLPNIDERSSDLLYEEYGLTPEDTL
jgi:hypothetical protein